MDYCLHTAGQEASKMLELDPLAKAFHTKEKEGNNRICCKGTRMYKQIPQNDNMVYVFGNHLYISKKKNGGRNRSLLWRTASERIVWLQR
jgi:hypothetical protein